MIVFRGTFIWSIFQEATLRIIRYSKDSLRGCSKDFYREVWNKRGTRYWRGYSFVWQSSFLVDVFKKNIPSWKNYMQEWKSNHSFKNKMKDWVFNCHCLKSETRYFRIPYNRNPVDTSLPCVRSVKTRHKPAVCPFLKNHKRGRVSRFMLTKESGGRSVTKSEGCLFGGIDPAYGNF